MTKLRRTLSVTFAAAILGGGLTVANITTAHATPFDTSVLIKLCKMGNQKACQMVGR